MAQQKKRFKLKNTLILATILALPGFLYTMLEQKGTNRYKPLPVYGEKTLTGTFTRKMGNEIPDTLFHQVDSFRLANQDGHLVSFPMSDTTITLVNLFYSRCGDFCDHIHKEMDWIAGKVINQGSVQLFSISVDSAYDTPQVLKEYSAAYNPGERKWNFLTGGHDLSDVIELANSDFLLNAVQVPDQPDKFVHSSSIVMLDSRRRIRGVYEVNQPKEIDRLLDEIKLQLVEEIRLKSPY